jgi:hypothetical protein
MAETYKDEDRQKQHNVSEEKKQRHRGELPVTRFLGGRGQALGQGVAARKGDGREHFSDEEAG